MKKLLIGSILLAFMGCSALASSSASAVLSTITENSKDESITEDYLIFNKKIVDNHFAKSYVIGMQDDNVILIPRNVIESIQDNEDNTYTVLTKKGYEYENVTILGLSSIKSFRTLGD